MLFFFFFFSSRRRHTRCSRDWSSDVCSSDLYDVPETLAPYLQSGGLPQVFNFQLILAGWRARSEEHTSELQSRLHLVCRLLLEKKTSSHIYNQYSQPRGASVIWPWNFSTAIP